MMKGLGLVGALVLSTVVGSLWGYGGSSCRSKRYLGEHGAPYQKRGDYFVDVSAFSPKEGETYDSYQGRVANTLSTQEEQVKLLTEGIKEKGQTISHLDDQLSKLQSQHVDLRLSLTQLEQATVEKEKRKVPFSRYIVQKGDTLQSIAYQKYASHSGWLNVYRFNMANLPNGPNKIEVGQVLLIPNLANKAKDT